jgi:hypothetical protein
LKLSNALLELEVTPASIVKPEIKQFKVNVILIAKVRLLFIIRELPHLVIMRNRLPTLIIAANSVPLTIKVDRVLALNFIDFLLALDEASRLAVVVKLDNVLLLTQANITLAFLNKDKFLSSIQPQAQSNIF